jgi:hypothetical protein
MVKKILLLASFAALTISISANTNTSELDKFNSAQSNVSFTENKGQISDQNYNPRPDVLFSGAANGLTFHIRNNGVSYQTSRVDSWKQQDENLPEGIREEGTTDSVPDQMTIYRTDINWLGFNRDYTIENGESTAGFNNYYLPSCPDGAMNVKSYTDVTFKNLYTGVDVKWYEKNGELEYDFIVAPNTDYTKISWEIKGADRISIGENGQLIIETPLGNIEEQAPIAFQGETIVEATWKIDGNKISFQLGSYNENEVLIIDPVVRLWGTYYGGAGSDFGNSCTTDVNGNVYLAGQNNSSSGIATTGAHQAAYGGGGDAFLVKFNSSGVRQWGTYYGGTSSDGASSCAADTSGNIYLGGHTQSSSGIASTGAHQTSRSSWSMDGFLVKFNSSGVRQWGTYYGGSGNEGSGDASNICATDTNGNVFLAGNTTSNNRIATTGAHQATYGGGSKDAYLVKFNSSGVRQWGTYFGGTSSDVGSFCATDASGSSFLSGLTESSNGIATTGAHQTSHSSSVQDGFLVKFNSSGVRQWGTYYGGSRSNLQAFGCATDGGGNAYLSGYTESYTGIATTGSHQTSWGGGTYDGFLVKFNSTGVRQWGTYYGGSGNEGDGNFCATDVNGNVYLAGQTNSSNRISSTGAHKTSKGANWESFLVKFDACPAVYGQDSITACDRYTWIDGVTYTLSDTTAKDTLVNASGCDSIVSLFLTINNSTSAIDAITACDSYTWIDGVTYTLSDTTAKDTLVNAAGCDSIVSLFLTINNSTSAIDTITACDSYTWIDGVTYYDDNITAKDTLVNAAGCDSIVSLFLTINNSTSAIDTITACDSYTWIDGVTYTLSDTTAKDTLINAAGCDSIVSLNLTINYTKTTTDSIVANDSYTWIDGVTYTSSNTTVTDTSEASNGCDSIVSLNLTIVSTVGIDNSAILSNVKVYPNPTSGKLTIDVENYEGVEVYDVSGRLIIKSSLKTIDLEEQSKGLYLLKVNANGTTQEFKVFKE